MWLRLAFLLGLFGYGDFDPGLVEKVEAFASLQFPRQPKEEALRFLNGIHYIGHLIGLVKDAFVNELIIFRQEDAEAGMGVNPSDHLQIRILLLHDSMDVVPSVVGKSQRRRRCFRMLGLNEASNHDVGFAKGLDDVAYQDAATFVLGFAEGKGLNALVCLLGDVDPFVGIHLVSHHDNILWQSGKVLLWFLLSGCGFLLFCHFILLPWA